MTDLLAVYLNEELAQERPTMRTSMINGGPEVVEKHRAEFRDLLSRRPMTRDEFWKATGAWFDGDEELYAAIADAYRFFFAEEPPASTIRTTGPTRSPW